MEEYKIYLKIINWNSKSKLYITIETKNMQVG